MSGVGRSNFTRSETLDRMFLWTLDWILWQFSLGWKIYLCEKRSINILRYILPQKFCYLPLRRSGKVFLPKGWYLSGCSSRPRWSWPSPVAASKCCSECPISDACTPTLKSNKKVVQLKIKKLQSSNVKTFIKMAKFLLAFTVFMISSYESDHTKR
jgi:hypothetical protein